MSGKGLSERFALSAVSPHLQQKDAGNSTMEYSCSSKPTRPFALRTRVGYRITSDGPEEDGGAEGTATNTEMPSDTGACAEDGEICSDSYNITDGNPTQAGGEIAMDSHGSLSLQMQGSEFNKVDFNRHEEYFSLQCVEHPKLFLALNNDDQFTVRGMSQQDMRDKSDSRWKYHFFKDIGGSCSDECADIVLQYYGNRFDPDPDKVPYYLVIELTHDRVPVFKIADKKMAKYLGRLGIIKR